MTDDLIERALRGGASEAELAALVAWRRAAPENEQHYRRIERLIAAARTLRADAAVPRPSAASIIASAPNTSPQRGEAGRDAAARARPHTGPRGSSRRSRLARSAPWAVAAAAVLVAMLNLRDAGGPADSGPAEVFTGATELATVKLSDGTVVRLAPSSRLQFDGGSGRDGRGAREVTLEGRAFFVVAKQPSGQPFRVRTPAATANVLGTRFELVTEETAVRLHVVEGRVALDAPRNSVEVGAGQQSGVRDGVATAPTPADDAGREPAWLGKFLVFQATPLAQAAREIERLFGVRVILADSGLAGATVTATFTDRPIDDVVGVICEVLSVPCLVQDGIATIGR